MAANNLPSLTHPQFPQVFSSAIDQLGTVVEEVMARIAAKPKLGSCNFANEYDDCHAPAVVHDLARDEEFCVRHFLAVNRA